ncbi:MAG TPA: hypothetical protein VFR11_14885 [Micromonosporaceae bacterium]|jgi:hypothetical protein|nr:hypothetical protein [Micromonosporaceae bacterium]
MMATEHWTVEHFSQANPSGSELEDDVPASLRRVADSIEGLGRTEVQDLLLHRQITDDGRNWYSLTVYFHRPEG